MGYVTFFSRLFLTCDRWIQLNRFCTRCKKMNGLIRSYIRDIFCVVTLLVDMYRLKCRFYWRQKETFWMSYWHVRINISDLNLTYYSRTTFLLNEKLAIFTALLRSWKWLWKVIQKIILNYLFLKSIKLKCNKTGEYVKRTILYTVGRKHNFPYFL